MVARAQKNLSKHNVGNFDITVQLTVDASEIQENDIKKMKKNIYEKKIFLFNCNCKSANIMQQTYYQIFKM